MEIIRKEPNLGGAYSAPQTWDNPTVPEGYAIIANTVDMSDFYAYNGFVTLTVEQVEHTRQVNKIVMEDGEPAMQIVDEPYTIDTVTVYTPNSEDVLKSLDYRMSWEDAFLAYIKKLDQKKPVVFCGDLNVAHKEIDLKNPKSNTKNPGFTKEEREKMDKLLGSGFLDTFRVFYPDLTDAYSWWSYRFKARERNSGWRIDYFVVSNRLCQRVQNASILNEIFGSDHCPVELILK